MFQMSDVEVPGLTILFSAVKKSEKEIVLIEL